MDLKETHILGSKISEHWYYRAKAKALAKMLAETKPSKILDVGAGSGFFSRHLLAHTDAKEAWCIDTNYDTDSQQTEAGKPIRFLRELDHLDADLVMMMDVLEHVDDDVGLLNEYVRKVPVGARFLVSVPAFDFLWSEHDLFLDHRRRYTLARLQRVMTQTGLQIEQGAYYFGAVFPLAATLRLLEKLSPPKKTPPQSQLKRHHPLVNSFLSALCTLELPFLPHNRFAGLTVFCVAKKCLPHPE